MKQQIAITFDVDMMDYIGHKSKVDEFEESFSAIKKILINFPHVKTTWFVRIDSQMSALYGRSDFLFHRHASEMDWLHIHGHQIGWHHHAYRFHNGIWSQETRADTAINEIRRYGEMARRRGILVSRMGWGWQTNEVIQVLDGLGFEADSSCIPRPCYPWEQNAKDWSRAPSKPYFPSQADYQIPGNPSFGILQIPMTVTNIPAPGDTVEMQRYLNLAYRPDVFARALSGLKERSLLLTITHPYELLRNSKTHPLISFDMEVLKINLAHLNSINAEFVTLDEVTRSHSL